MTELTELTELTESAESAESARLVESAEWSDGGIGHGRVDHAVPAGHARQAGGEQ
ncbi:hypothetical protein [Streptomyces noursei]|uniref:hypothetical protein n=1 Tax=Streptomyces noursei TaxID=1971 RepID=UPI0023B82FEB|nr:hypothetical protein [Streptomyces noursei]